MNHTVRKRKDREQNSSFHRSSKGSFGISYKQKQQQVNSTTSSNELLAGYMAHEFLTRGTLFGQKFDPERAEAVPLAAADPKRKLRKPEPDLEQPNKEMNRTYAEVAKLMKTDGVHIPGVVNPTQLARWIQM